MAHEHLKTSSGRSVGQLWVELSEQERTSICEAIGKHNKTDVLEQFTLLVGFTHTLRHSQQHTPSPTNPPGARVEARPTPTSQSPNSPQLSAGEGLKRKGDNDDAVEAARKRTRLGNMTITRQKQDGSQTSSPQEAGTNKLINSTTASTASSSNVNTTVTASTPKPNPSESFLSWSSSSPSSPFASASSATSGALKLGVVASPIVFGVSTALGTPTSTANQTAAKGVSHVETSLTSPSNTMALQVAKSHGSFRFGDHAGSKEASDSSFSFNPDLARAPSSGQGSGNNPTSSPMTLSLGATPTIVLGSANSTSKPDKTDDPSTKSPATSNSPPTHSSLTSTSVRDFAMEPSLSLPPAAVASSAVVSSSLQHSKCDHSTGASPGKRLYNPKISVGTKSKVQSSTSKRDSTLKVGQLSATEQAKLMTNETGLGPGGFSTKNSKKTVNAVTNSTMARAPNGDGSSVSPGVTRAHEDKMGNGTSGSAPTMDAVLFSGAEVALRKSPPTASSASRLPSTSTTGTIFPGTTAAAQSQTAKQPDGLMRQCDNLTISPMQSSLGYVDISNTAAPWRGAAAGGNTCPSASTKTVATLALISMANRDLQRANLLCAYGTDEVYEIGGK
ncbi:hypothetical protein VSDG_09698 [Cytospora chrysosperma]|uniref:Uncharacterized protein n=1 Tax=Cytospora chrysosperma TaxID=252740 RepID=A0A423V983_CYTCH|nr:hypothetical protein VSDG_09698 [Valsa sordida]